eukprot:TRINITY_DN2487_c0_g1_i2.p1 TRINITY_DN2487_c0_g1~~TRINITY_DN2487_c0_g1_i2.p1  ORF type:complete len:389 (+),score=85.32 TRINITY_DN2487_c0_g1_i2:482-1648(+)
MGGCLSGESRVTETKSTSISNAKGGYQASDGMNQRSGSAPGKKHDNEEDHVAAYEGNDGISESDVTYELRVFTFANLQTATKEFEEGAVLGEGGFGKVYKGYISEAADGGVADDLMILPVAIKKLNPKGYQSQQEWTREIIYLGKLQHPNLVKLIGYCAETNLETQASEMLLVYEYLSKGSLDYHLWPAENSGLELLPWRARLRIALDAARGLSYLHAKNVIHRDFKAPNILLDDDYNGKLTDFGLAKDGPDAGHTHVSTQIMGTMGYLDPRYAETGQLSMKSDVYAYGVVLLELLTGKKAMGVGPGGRPKTLTAWARPLLNKSKPDLELLVDPNLSEPFPEKVARTLAISAKHCIQDDSSMRPLMTDIVDTLKPLDLAINGPKSPME